MYKNNIGDILLSIAAFFQIAVLMLKELMIAAQFVEQESFRMMGIMLAALPMVPAIYYIVLRKLALTITTYLIVIYVVILTLIFFADNEPYILSGPFNESGAFYLLFINIPSFLCLASIRDVANLRRILLYISYLIFALGIYYCLLLWIGRISYVNYSMSFSYYLLVPALVFASQRRILYMLLFFCICIMMLMLGSRGALVAGLIYVLLILLTDRKSRNLLLSSTILIVFLFGSILSIILTFSFRTGVASRTLDMIQQGTLGESSGRDWIYTTTWKSIMDNPIWGHGIFGDRVVLDGEYCHNFLLEIFHNFGLLFGAALILLLLIVTVRAYLISNTENRLLLLLLGCYSIIPLLVSSSYLEDPKFGIFIGSLIIFSKDRSIAG